jgi:hypothetical protein
MRYRNGLVAVGLIGTLLAGSACGVPSSKAVKATGGSAPGAGSTTSVPTGTTSTDTGATSTTRGSDPTTAPAVSTGPLRGKLLTVADLPPGWEVDPNASSDSGSDSTSSDSGSSKDCINGDPTAAPFKLLSDTAKIQFQKKSRADSAAINFDLVAEQLSRGSSGDVSATYAKTLAALDPCVGTHAAQDGSEMTGAIERRSISTSADESTLYVVRVSTGAPSTTGALSLNLDFAIDILIARKGNTLMLLGYSPDTKGDAALIALADKALAKL